MDLSSITQTKTRRIKGEYITGPRLSPRIRENWHSNIVNLCLLEDRSIPNREISKDVPLTVIILTRFGSSDSRRSPSNRVLFQTNLLSRTMAYILAAIYPTNTISQDRRFARRTRKVFRSSWNWPHSEAKKEKTDGRKN